VRWSVLNVAALLRRHAGLHDRLAAAMSAGASVGSCIALIEDTLSRPEEDDAIMTVESG
jgi:NAD(P)H-nitrite reductase large subunit